MESTLVLIQQNTEIRDIIFSYKGFAKSLKSPVIRRQQRNKTVHVKNNLK